MPRLRPLLLLTVTLVATFTVTLVEIIARDRTARPVAGRYNICYVNGFQTQPDQLRFWRHHRGLLLERRGRLVVDDH